MFSLTRYTTPCPEPINSQILQLAVDNLTDISSVALAPSNLLYNIYQYAIGFEVHLYLEALDGSKGIRVELVVALQDETVVGFCLYLPVKGDPQACGVAFMAVHAGSRRQGVARAMLDDVLARYPHAELACSVEKVPAFEAMGFKVRGARGTQVLMNTRDYGTDGLMGVLDVAAVYSSLEVRQIHTYLLQKHGKRAMVDAEKQRDRHLDQLTRKVRVFVDQRLA
ncbi:GNAT family N-acetyltransferase [Pseudomonas fluorescens]|uniref:GNAT family N-acetyltransferase n=1 Tax=Pseudomonas fluorescens TaxID=294 RepID=A0A2N1DTQ4_PSEFL|nr:GNAT family N-acetyltransferase [Pseudomonas fluorescens]MBD8099882.1 GNAT family N-acetyltransferase [Pseudomonas fluorescens]MBD8774318.1 GNAT family N-acetyltransferase [Pseudomonas fluorescens]MBD8781381.1 GNAT family N-acetyltransferase [Pseudomonas fluorescens]MBD8796526.1 GNAT family N-acetyltransferase [Pseudomonas fluorescens]PKH12696.1 GNAT family N-acetyltransferase [Pseudomonas fluorescens]